MIKNIFQLKEIPKPDDTADAIIMKILINGKLLSIMLKIIIINKQKKIIKLL